MKRRKTQGKGDKKKENDKKTEPFNYLFLFVGRRKQARYN
jgi:hypothetical protein